MLSDFSTEILAFIEENRHENPETLALKIPKNSDWDTTAIINQLRGYQKAQYKLPLWYNNEGIRFPNRISMEQCSSEQTASYKASLISGDICWDMTGGFGVDDYYFAKQFKQVVSCEMQNDLSEIAAYNFKQMGTDNITCVSGNSIELLRAYSKQIDCIYLDPARRADSDQRVFLLEDCVPNILELQDELFEKSPMIVLKTAPVLDIHQSCKQLKGVSDVHIISVNNECKEVLYVLRRDYTASVQYHAINLKNDGTKDILSADDRIETQQNLVLGEISNYLYEPNASLMKAGFFKSICSWFPVKKLHQHSHLYTSENLIEKFPGRSFKIIGVTQVQKKKIARFLPEKKAHISIRNFPSTVKDLRKKLGIKEGGDHYLFVSTDCNNQHIVLICKKAL